MSNEKKATRSRSSSSMSPGMADANPGIADGTREEKAHGVTLTNRIPLGGASQTLALPIELKERFEREGKHLHWIRDDERGRYQAAKNSGYEHVVDDQGNNVRRNSGDRILYLMALPKEFREQDLKLKKQRAAASLGEQVSIGDGEYSPTGGSSAIKSTTSDNAYTQLEPIKQVSPLEVD